MEKNNLVIINPLTYNNEYIYIYRKTKCILVSVKRDRALLSLAFASQAISSVSFVELLLILLVTCLLRGITFFGFSVGGGGGPPVLEA